ncbi:MAG: hypothetical protein NWR87_08810 [Rhodospirillales bacterium]|nr:hypothetical protein [Rhodospirillales bacterium]
MQYFVNAKLARQTERQTRPRSQFTGILQQKSNIALLLDDGQRQVLLNIVKRRPREIDNTQTQCRERQGASI